MRAQGHHDPLVCFSDPDGASANRLPWRRAHGGASPRFVHVDGVSEFNRRRRQRHSADRRVQGTHRQGRFIYV